MSRFRFREMGTTGDYNRTYAAIDREAKPVGIIYFHWRRDGVLVFPKTAKGIGDDLYREFVEWLEGRHPEEARMATVRWNLQVPLEMPKSMRWS